MPQNLNEDKKVKKNDKLDCSEVKTLEWANVKVTFDNNYRYDAILIGLISDWTTVSCSQAGF